MKVNRFTPRTVPWLLLALCILGFGLLIPALGLYWDDWPVILMARLQDARGFWEFYQYDRPISAWTYILTVPIFGSRPITWHIFSLLLRWATVVGMWWCLCQTWPERKREVTWMAVLFAIFPSFLQQPVAVAFSQHWITYTLYFLSIGCMLQALKPDRWRWLFAGIALFSCALHLLTMEYFIGLELLRPVFLWIALEIQGQGWRQHLFRVFKWWLPYVLVLLGFAIWRVFFLELAGKDPNTASLISNLTAQPISAALGFIQTVFQDYLHVIAGTWAQTVDPAQIALNSAFFLFSFAAALLGGTLTAIYLLKLNLPGEGDNSSSNTWYKQAVLFGILAIFLGFLPAWITERQAIEGLYGSRFTLGAMFGSSMLIIGLLDWLTPRTFPKIVLISVLVGFAILFHFKNTNDYRWSWINQRRFYWQLYWRAPYISPNTAILSDGELFPFVGVYSTTTGLNLLYPQLKDSDTLGYWFYSVGRGLYRQIPQLLEGMKLKPTFRTFRFSGSSHDSIVLYYEPSEGRCLWLLDSHDSNLRDLPDLTRSVLPLSDLSRVMNSHPEENYPPEEVFGAELEHNWCYYFQKADLARQYGDWAEIGTLAEQAVKNGFKTDHYREALPFIEAYPNLGQWREAEMWTKYLNPRGPNPDLVCSLWNNLVDSTPPATLKDESVARIKAHFSCSP